MRDEYANRFITKFDSPMAAYVYERLSDIAEATCTDSVQYMALIGKRILREDSQGFVTLEKFDSEAKAERAYEDDLFPSDYDATISDSGSNYYVAAEGVEVGTFETREGAEYALAKWMADNGLFPSSWYINDRGNYFPIDEDIRKYHDEGGDKMRPQMEETN